MRTFMDSVEYKLGGRQIILTLKRSSGAEKMQKPRVPSYHPLQVVPIRQDGAADWEAAYQAVSLNFSQQGLGLLQENLATTQRVLIGIVVHQQTYYLPAEVRYCRSLGKNLVVLGCQFLLDAATQRNVKSKDPQEGVTSDVVHEAIANFVKSHQEFTNQANRRKHPRVIYNDRIEIFFAGSSQPAIAYTRDLSKGGMAFINTVSLPQEVTIVMRPRQGGTPLWVKSRVVR